ncbi:MAG: spore germination protein GerW family protein [Bacillota bacterium]|nr:spore germination protein GerW family protein [Bacillota bacterium]
MAHPIESLMTSVLENLKKMVDANTVIGEPINLPNGVSIIPVTKLNCGFGCGGGEYGTKPGAEKIPFGGGTGGGISLQPLGFISVSDMDVKYTPVDSEESGAVAIADIVVETITKVADKFEDRKKQKAQAEAAAEDVIEDIIEEKTSE